MTLFLSRKWDGLTIIKLDSAQIVDPEALHLRTGEINEKHVPYFTRPQLRVSERCQTEIVTSILFSDVVNRISFSNALSVCSDIVLPWLDFGIKCHYLGYFMLFIFAIRALILLIHIIQSAEGARFNTAFNAWRYATITHSDIGIRPDYV